MTEQLEPPIEVTVAAPPEVIWKALRDPELIRRWHGYEMDENGLDEEVRVIYATGVTEHPDRLLLEVNGGDRFTLHPAAGGTVVRVTRAPRGADPDWEAYYDEITEGWRLFLEQLRFAVERHGLARRRTVKLSGTLASHVSLVDELGLSPAADLAPGLPYRADAATGELRGYVWARSPGQLLLTVDSFGEGLLALMEEPVAPHRPAGGELVVLTCYGLDEVAFADLEQRWSAWWNRVTADRP